MLKRERKDQSTIPKLLFFLDINECKGSSLHDCHSNATCKNTVGSFNCTCKQGFHGDGKISCKGE